MRGDKICKWQIDPFKHLWLLLSDVTEVGIDRFMHCTLYGVLKTTTQTRWRICVRQRYFRIKLCPVLLSLGCNFKFYVVFMFLKLVPALKHLSGQRITGPIPTAVQVSRLTLTHRKIRHQMGVSFRRHNPAALSRERSCNCHCKGDWVGSWDGEDTVAERAKFHLFRDRTNSVFQFWTQLSRPL